MTSPRRLRVSDHALVRFLARAGGFEVEAVRAQLEASLSRAAAAADRLAEADFIIRADGLSYVVSNGVVVTIYGREKS